MGTISLIYVAALTHIVILLAGLPSPGVFAADPPLPAWSRYGCNSGFNFCANVTTKGSWYEEGNDIYIFLDALVYEDDFEKANTTVWYVGDNFDESWASDLRREAFNVVRFSFRGSEFAYPRITCKPEHYNRTNHCLPNVECAREVGQSGLNMRHYSTNETARDLAWVVRALGRGKQNVIVAEGLGTFVVQRLLEMGEDWKNVSFIMAGFTHPRYFDIFMSVSGYDGALQRVLELCERDKTLRCISRVGAVDGLWDRVVNVMRAAEANTLRCNSLLNWGVEEKYMHREYRSIIAALMKKPQNFVMLSDWKLLQLIPSFIYRLQRCEARDQQALTRLREFVNSEERNRCPPFVPQRYNWLVNELTLTRPPKLPKDLMEETAQDRVVMPNITLLQQLYDAYNAYPKYETTKISVATTHLPLLMLPSDVDPVFPYGMAAMASAVYGGTVHILPHQAGLPVANSASNCIKMNLMHYRVHLKWGDAAQCKLDNVYHLNFTDFDAYEFYGVMDAWEFTTPNMPEPTPNMSTTTTTEAPRGSGKDCSKKTVGFVTVLFVLTLLGLLGMTYLYWTKTRALKFSDDFYSNLNH